MFAPDHFENKEPVQNPSTRMLKLAETEQRVRTGKLRAIIYCRVSSEQQEKDGDSLEFQEEKGKLYAESQGYEIVLVLKEIQSGFVHYSMRPKLTLAREMIKEGVADVLIVWDLRRFSRNFVHSALIFEEIEQAGGVVESVSEKIDNTLTGKLIRSILSWCAESERHKIVEYANRNWQTKLEKGLPIGAGRKPYGWNWGDETKTFYVINKEEKLVRLSIFRMFLEEDMSLRAIADKLTDDGIPSPQPPKKEGRIPRWHTTTVRDILIDERNIGILCICAYQKIAKGSTSRAVRRNNPNVKKIPGGIPAIMSNERLEQAKLKLAQNKISRSNRPEDEESFLLRGGHIICKSCGWRMYSKNCKNKKSKNGMQTMYRCSGREHRQCLEPTACGTESINDYVWQKCCKLFQRAERLKKALERAIDSEVGNLHGEEKLEEKIQQLKEAIIKGYQEREKAGKDTLLYDLITEGLHAKNTELKALEEEKKQVRPIEFRANLYKDKVLKLIDFLDVMKGKYHEASFKDKRNAIEVLGVKVYVSKPKNLYVFEPERFEVTCSPHFLAIANADDFDPSCTKPCLVPVGEGQFLYLNF